MSAQIRGQFSMPKFLHGKCLEEVFARWLQRKAATHARRDRKRGSKNASISAYKLAIHAAVERCGGRDCYTGEILNWSLLCRYRNEDSLKGRGVYKSKFALLPSVDHVGRSARSVAFEICGWRTNDAKGDLSHTEFLRLCRKIIRHALRKQR